jgi:hypothetical protein
MQDLSDIERFRGTTYCKDIAQENLYKLSDLADEKKGAGPHSNR